MAMRAEIIIGTCNPSGHLPITFPLFTGQLPMPYNHRPYGRNGTVLEVPGVDDSMKYTPLLPFGFGLSYTSFHYSDLSIVPQRIFADERVHIAAKITNAGVRSGGEVVQLYLSYARCRITQPVQRLCAFRRLFLDPGSSEVISFTLGSGDLAFLNEDLRPEVNVGSCDRFNRREKRHSIRQATFVSSCLPTARERSEC